MWSLLVGALAPPGVAFIQQPGWSRPLRAAVTLLVCLLLGAGTAWFNGDLAARNLVSATLLVLVSTHSTYLAFWKPTRIAGAIENATSP